MIKAWLSFVVCVSLSVGFSESAMAQPASVDQSVDESSQQLADLLDWLEVATAARQADRLIQQSLARDTQLSAEQREGLQQTLQQATGSEAVAAAVQAYIAQHSRTDLAPALQVYQMPIAKRARNFEAALGLSTAAGKFHQFQQQHTSSEQRRALARQLDGLLHCSEIAVILQTEIDISARMLSAKLTGEQDHQWSREELASQQALRQAHMAALAEDLLLYAYRFFKDDELKAYVAELDTPAVRALTDSALKAFPQVLKAGRAVALTDS